MRVEGGEVGAIEGALEEVEFQRLMGGGGPEVVVFVRIGLEVVEFALVGQRDAGPRGAFGAVTGVISNELVVLGSEAGGVGAGVSPGVVVFAEDVVAVFGSFAAKEGEEGSALEAVGGRGNVGGFAEGGGEVCQFG
jgi:hypothetical protein